VKILSKSQITDADTYTITNEPISSFELMQRAAFNCINALDDIHGHKEYIVFCGTGNNGGDGLCLASQIFADKVYVLNGKSRSADFIAAEKKYTTQTKLKPIYLDENKIAELDINKDVVIIDAIFGTGINRPVDGLAAKLIEKINTSGAEVVSIDIPSGLFCDDNSQNNFAAVVKATHTLSLQSVKTSMLLPLSGSYCGKLHVVDIKIHPDYLQDVKSNFIYINTDFTKLIYRKREKFSHKGTHGNALIIAGSKGMAGAAVLSAKACVHTGAGLTTAHVPAVAYSVLQTTVPEVICSADENEDHITSLPKLDKYNSVAIGPGIGTEKQIQNVLKLLLQNCKAPLVMDADALNIIAENKTWLSFLPAHSILTPHPKEFERLFGKTENDEERLKLQIEISRKYTIYIVFKTAHTCITCPDGIVFFNSTGNPGMAKGGSGDVLTGIIAGLIAQGYNNKEACVLGVYLHGLAADMAATKKAEEYISATDIILALADAYKSFQ
jgi:NAD(P)H-hydrate epimerase